MFWHSCCSDSSGEESGVKVYIQDFRSGPAKSIFTEKKQTILLRRYASCESTSVPNMACAIVSEIPSLDELLECSRNSHHSCNAGPFSTLHKSFSQFGERYCREDISLPLVRSMLSTQADSDAEIYRTARPDEKDSPHEILTVLDAKICSLESHANCRRV